MVFISGPRQSGKTTMVKELLTKGRNLYLNWDNSDHRKIIMKKDWDQNDKIICFDEIHKFSRWKNLVKGIYDTQNELHKFIITGSARLDIYKKGQDSMLGRFFSWRLHPLCLSELKHTFKITDKEMITRMLSLGAFPEPFFSNDLQFSKRWRLEKQNLVFRQDIQELENIRDISLLEFFFQALKERVGSEVALSNIARDIEVAPKTAKNWLSILEKTYALFVVTPYSKNLIKAITKTPKIYFYDNGEVEGDSGAQFENLVASHLLKKIHFLEDCTGDRYELNYLRDKTGHEIDFLIQKNRKPIALIEAKVSDSNRSQSFYYYKERLKIKTCVQLVLNLEKSSLKDDILVSPAFDWLSQPLGNEF
jgi:hypothetical protein